MDQKTRTKHRRHPYMDLENTLEWEMIYKAVEDLILNQDIILQTQKEYVVGYLVTKLSDRTTCKS